MSFECKFLNKAWCELRGMECVPGAKGCVLIKAGVKFVGQEDNEKDNKNGSGSVENSGK